MKRVVITVDVPESVSKYEVADAVNYRFFRWYDVPPDAEVWDSETDFLSDAFRVPEDQSFSAVLVSTDSLKMTREALVIAEQAMLKHPGATAHQIKRIGGLIADIDRQRPIGSDGKHGDRHTPTCGCEDKS